ncbi:unnamed protein product, partial [Discosporangium mesarthrocarpum]
PETRLIDIALGDTCSVALTSRGELWSVGAGSGRGQLGRGGKGASGLGSVSGIPDLRVAVRKVCAGRNHTAALTRHGTVFTFGENSAGQVLCGGRRLGA